ncbi:MAG: hypothetical protein HN509_09170 [Halobacteriovoraceae bacterium]|jgi:hypothetical protein|nr:hypothetical protein [Halobacteriovoraceae bacterium]MBT5093900.1 hypothetical protein [Halobacteriovoraceae bacterium]
MSATQVVGKLANFLLAAVYQAAGLSGRQFVSSNIEGLPNIFLGLFFVLMGIMIYLKLYQPFLFAGTKLVKTKKGTKKVKVKAKGLRKVMLGLSGLISLITIYIGVANILRGLMDFI